MAPRVTVLGSGVALGVYVPALLTASGLARHGVPAETLVIESLYTAAGLEMLERYRQAYHRSFSMALMGHRMTRDVRPSLEERAVGGLLHRWSAEDRRHFIVWSGFWMPVLDQYRQYREERSPGRLCIDLCRIDAEISATFKIYQDLADRWGGEAREIWLWSWEQRRLIHELPVSEEPPVPWEEREDRLVVHGGGWGIGTYLERLPELAASGLGLDVVVQESAEAGPREDGRRTFMVDPEWRAWREERCGFPPFGEVRESAAFPEAFRRREDRHEIYGLLRNARAILSKPGGGTLIDSLASATPVVLLEPYGYAEESNARIWEHLGFGVRYDRWKESGFSPALLERLHRNLIKRPAETIDYPAALAARLHELAA